MVYADWLEENGQAERAEFIRVQIELARRPTGQKPAGRLKKREEVLLEKHRAEWVAPLKPFTDERYAPYSKKPPCEFRRGFVEYLHLNGHAFIEQPGELFRLTPLRAGCFPDWPPFEQLAVCPQVARFRELDFSMAVKNEMAGPADLIGSKYLKNLEVLNLRGFDDNGHLDLPGLEAIVRARHLGWLRELDLSHNWFGDEGVMVLTRAKRLSALTQLSLESVELTDTGLHALIETLAPKLRHLNLAGNGISDEGADDLLQAATLGNLESLDLRRNESISRAARQDLRGRFGMAVLL